MWPGNRPDSRGHASPSCKRLSESSSQTHVVSETLESRRPGVWVAGGAGKENRWLGPRSVERKVISKWKVHSGEGKHSRFWGILRFHARQEYASYMGGLLMAPYSSVTWPGCLPTMALSCLWLAMMGHWPHNYSDMRYVGVWTGALLALKNIWPCDLGHVHISGLNVQDTSITRPICMHKQKECVCVCLWWGGSPSALMHESSANHTLGARHKAPQCRSSVETGRPCP